GRRDRADAVVHREQALPGHLIDQAVHPGQEKHGDQEVARESHRTAAYQEGSPVVAGAARTGYATGGEQDDLSSRTSPRKAMTGVSQVARRHHPGDLPGSGSAAGDSAGARRDALRLIVATPQDLGRGSAYAGARNSP